MNMFGLIRLAIFFFAAIAVTLAAVGAGASGDVYQIIYELQPTNTRPLPATIRNIDVLDASNASKRLTAQDFC